MRGGSHSGGGDVVQAVEGPSLGRTGRVPEVQAGPYGWSGRWGWVPEVRGPEVGPSPRRGLAAVKTAARPAWPGTQAQPGIPAPRNPSIQRAEPGPGSPGAGSRGPRRSLAPARPGAARPSQPPPSASRSLTEVVHGGTAGAGSRLGVPLSARPGAAPLCPTTFPPRASAGNGTRRRRARPAPASTRAPPPPAVAPGSKLAPPRAHASPAPPPARERAPRQRWATPDRVAAPPRGRAGKCQAPRPSGPAVSPSQSHMPDRLADRSISCVDISQSDLRLTIHQLLTHHMSIHWRVRFVHPSVCLSPSRSSPRRTPNQYQAKQGTFGGPFLGSSSGPMAVQLAIRTSGPDSVLPWLYIP